MHQTEKKITIVENLEDEKIHKMTTFELVAGLLDIEFKIYTGSSPNANSLSGKFNHSYLSNKRTCPLILFKKKVQPTL